jgi:hypothetical protein
VSSRVAQFDNSVQFGIYVVDTFQKPLHSSRTDTSRSWIALDISVAEAETKSCMLHLLRLKQRTIQLSAYRPCERDHVSKYRDGPLSVFPGRYQTTRRPGGNPRFVAAMPESKCDIRDRNIWT